MDVSVNQRMLILITTGLMPFKNKTCAITLYLQSTSGQLNWGKRKGGGGQNEVWIKLQIQQSHFVNIMMEGKKM